MFLEELRNMLFLPSGALGTVFEYGTRADLSVRVYALE